MNRVNCPYIIIGALLGLLELALLLPIVALLQGIRLLCLGLKA